MQFDILVSLHFVYSDLDEFNALGLWFGSDLPHGANAEADQPVSVIQSLLALDPVSNFIFVLIAEAVPGRLHLSPKQVHSLSALLHSWFLPGSS